MNFQLNNRGSRSCERLVAILRERFAREQDGFLASVAGSRRSAVARAFGAAIVETALLRTAGFEAARLLAAIVKPAGISA